MHISDDAYYLSQVLRFSGWDELDLFTSTDQNSANKEKNKKTKVYSSKEQEEVLEAPFI